VIGLTGATTERIRIFCAQMLARLDLVSGAFDFIVSRDGDWFFLEVNPTGEWAWLEEFLGLPIRDAFIEVLYP